MRKTFGLVCFLALSLGGVTTFAQRRVMTVPSTTNGQPFGTIKVQGADPHSMVTLKAQNRLSGTTNQLLLKEKSSAGGSFANPGIKDGTVDTLPYFNSWFITGTRNSIYTYSMLGHSPKLGGTTGINNQIIPLITVLLYSGSEVATFDPTVTNDPQGDDIALLGQSPLYDATTTYPGNGGTLPADTGQLVDTNQRAEFSPVRTADWHTPLNAPMSSGIVWIQFLEYSHGDWTFACCDQDGNNYPVVNINTISNNFGFILSSEVPANSTFAIIVTDYVAAFDPSNGSCCILGYHNAQAGIVDPAGILVWAWASFLPQSDVPFAPGFEDVSVFSHEITETYNDPFVNTAVAPWVDGSVSFSQGNLETGDATEAMKASDAIYPVPLSTLGGAYTFHVQNEALLEWFTRNPKAPVTGPGPGVYSWPNTNTLNNGHNPAEWVYGEGPAGFFFGPPY